MNPADLLRIAQERYTTKHYTGEKVPQEKIDALLEILRLTPSSVNSQPWHFYVASTDEAKAKILPAIADFNRDRVSQASHVVICAVHKSLDDAHFKALLGKEIEDGRYTKAEIGPEMDAGRRGFAAGHAKETGSTFEWSARQCYIAQGFLLFAAAGMGVDSTPIEGADMLELDKILGLKEKNMRTLYLVSLGVRDPNDSNAKRPKSRLSLSQVVTEL